MYYENPFYITDPVGNNAFSFYKRENKRLYVPSLKKIESFEEIELGDEVVFEDYDFNRELQSCKGLKNFYELTRPHPNPLLRGEGITQTIFLFDNHNHAYFFWYLARERGIIGDNNIFYHMDEHSDMRDPGKYLLKPESEDLEKVFHYCNYDRINVGNYIIPAQKEGIISEIVQIRSAEELENVGTNLFECHSGLVPGSFQEENLSDSKDSEFISKGQKQGIIFNLDLDFFQPDLDFIDYDLKKEVFYKIVQEADVITVATSPFFINQELALRVFRDLFE